MLRRWKLDSDQRGHLVPSAASRFYVGITSDAWVDALRRLPFIEDRKINFWRPTPGRGFAVLRSGEVFLFKRHAPSHAIVGGATYERFASQSLRQAWEAFGTANGASSLDEMRASVAKYRRTRHVDDSEMIGCIVLTRPFFWCESHWLRPPADWARNIVQGRSYDLHSPPGSDLWKLVVERQPGLALLSSDYSSPGSRRDPNERRQG